MGNPLTDFQMRQRLSFLDWDFCGSPLDGITDIWTMGGSHGYPVHCNMDGRAYLFSWVRVLLNPPYVVESVDHIRALYDNPFAHYQLKEDLNLAGIEWRSAPVPMFWGVLDGASNGFDGFTITAGSYLGFFGELSKTAVVRNLYLEDVDAIALAGSNRIGTLVGVNRGSIQFCMSTGRLIVPIIVYMRVV